MFKHNKTVLLLFALLIIFSLSTNVLAAPLPRYVASCPASSKHKMVGRGSGTVYSGSYSSPGTALIYKQFAHQCIHCHLVLVSEGDPHQSGILGKFTLATQSEPVFEIGVVLYGYTVDEFYGNLKTDVFWSGFAW